MGTKKLSEGELLPEEPDFAEYHHYTGPATIPVGGQLPVWEQRFALNEQEWVQLALQKLILLILGEVTYSDTFDLRASPHVTRFCIRIVHPLRDPFPNQPVQITEANFWYLYGPDAYNLKT